MSVAIAHDFQTPISVACERFAHLPARIVNVLLRRGIRSWEQIAALSDEQLMSVDKLGAKSVAAIRAEQRVQRG